MLRGAVIFLILAQWMPALGQWKPVSAAAYLDARASWWMNWPTAARDHQTFCISCHTAVPYAIGRPALRTRLHETGASEPEKKLLENVTRRVRMWKQVEPFYPDATRGVPKTAESRGTEAVLNALILASENARSGILSADAKLALDNMWSEQSPRGNWGWLQFHNAPWEGDSEYYGATLAALALGTAPGGYQHRQDVQAGSIRLCDYLRERRDSQTLLDRLMLLWASVKMERLLNVAEQRAIVEEVLARQQADGGFSLASLVDHWKRRDATAQETKSDGYATGLAVLVIKQVDRDRPQLKSAVAWLEQNQNARDGRWLAYSLNKQRDLTTDVGKFMSDAATAYAVLALEAEN